MRKLSNLDFKWRDERKNLFFKNLVFRAFLFCSFYCFGNKLGTHNKGTLFSPEQRSENLEQTAPLVGSKLEHKVPSHVSQKEQLVLLGTKGPLQFKVLSGS